MLASYRLVHKDVHMDAKQARLWLQATKTYSKNESVQRMADVPLLWCAKRITQDACQGDEGIYVNAPNVFTASHDELW